MLLEMHCHSSEHSPCSIISAVDLVQQVYAKNLQGVVITDHHYVWPAEELTALRHAAAVPDYFLIFSGQEVSTSDMGHILIFGADVPIREDTPASEIRAGFPDAAIVRAHPYRGDREPTMDKLLHPLFDGIEIFSSNHTVKENLRGLRDWHQYKFTAIGGTDTHGQNIAGTYPTQFDHPFQTMEELVLEIRKGRCRPFYKEIPKSGSTLQVTEITIGTKGEDEIRPRIIIKKMDNQRRWERAKRAYTIMNSIARHGFENGTYRVPKLIDEDAGTLTLIEQGVRGKSLFDKLKTADLEDGRRCIRLSAEWLANLHNARIQVTPAEEFLSLETKRLKAYHQRFVSCRHPQSQKAGEIMEMILRMEKSLMDQIPESLVQGHGDYHPKNIIIGQDNMNDRETLYISAIDFESSYTFPRAFDVGSFLAQFQNQFFRYKEVLKSYPEEIFLDAYIKSSETLSTEFSKEVELFRARTCLSIAAYLIKLGLGESPDLNRVIEQAGQTIAMIS